MTVDDMMETLDAKRERIHELEGTVALMQNRESVAGQIIDEEDLQEYEDLLSTDEDDDMDEDERPMISTDVDERPMDVDEVEENEFLAGMLDNGIDAAVEYFEMNESEPTVETYLISSDNTLLTMTKTTLPFEQGSHWGTISYDQNVQDVYNRLMDGGTTAYGPLEEAIELPLTPKTVSSSLMKLGIGSHPLNERDKTSMAAAEAELSNANTQIETDANSKGANIVSGHSTVIGKERIQKEIDSFFDV